MQNELRGQRGGEGQRERTPLNLGGLIVPCPVPSCLRYQGIVAAISAGLRYCPVSGMTARGPFQGLPPALHAAGLVDSCPCPELAVPGPKVQKVVETNGAPAYTGLRVLWRRPDRTRPRAPRLKGPSARHRCHPATCPSRPGWGIGETSIVMPGLPHQRRHTTPHNAPVKLAVRRSWASANSPRGLPAQEVSKMAFATPEVRTACWRRPGSAPVGCVGACPCVAHLSASNWSALQPQQEPRHRKKSVEVSSNAWQAEC